MKLSSIKAERQVLLLATAGAVLLWVIPFAHAITLPLQYLNTHVHELFHAFAGTLTGGFAQSITVYADGSGVTPVYGGNLFAIASAGYVGAAALGGGLVAAAGTERGARVSLWLLAGMLLYSMGAWVRGDTVGVVSGVLWVVTLAAAASKLRGLWLVFAAQFLGMQQALTSFQSILALLHVSAFSQAHSDARLMEDETNLPAILWAGLWALLSLVLVVLALRVAWRRSQAATVAGAPSP